MHSFDVWNRDSGLHPLALDTLRKHWEALLANTLEDREFMTNARAKRDELAELTGKPEPLRFGPLVQTHAERAREELNLLRVFLDAVER